MDRDTALTRLRAFVADCSADLGHVPVTRVMRRHLTIFSDLRGAGLTWTAIADLVATAGISKKPDTWRRLYCRVEQEDGPKWGN